MGFWIFMLIMDLLIPFTMIGFGKSFLKNPPKEINAVFGYRTTMSSKNKDTWIFAHKYCGKIWYICGLILLPISIIVMAMVFGKPEDTVGTVGGVLCGIQMIPLIGSIIPTEKALRKTLIKMGSGDELGFVEENEMENKKALKLLYGGSSVFCWAIAGIWAFTAKRLSNI